MSNVFIIDNVDSFTYNLVDQIRSLNHKVIIYRNNIPINFLLKKLSKIKNPILLLSPGSGLPSKAGFMPNLLKILIGKIPIIGICLGHQALIESYGGCIIRAKEIFHGKSSTIIHDNKDMFYGVKNPMNVARYHSLIANKTPNILTINSKCKNIIMSFRYNFHRTCGFQFHPESILTPDGDILMKKTIHWALS
ncbi:anthranilate synthase component II [Enterobacteriaceae endosymbiont of Plateumaris consimilis]|uniref:aminodeoxychorismate/anthranilate synthase component II n=1 Tax=Enterobacteriaceae endosymbiont of Plateumaris consimilis TaxID=2675794 RepID=UPI0014490343|nr:aminodeoxychorismate/anthranilate synthase component II [Enterobacteriaceae endosymbiont of Plateumaris consimilis]QJC28513.1 anthranilate synthase component II [Enterobacteriaceae endosymbiont of Plateumaris consimilis]